MARGWIGVDFDGTLPRSQGRAVVMFARWNHHRCQSCGRFVNPGVPGVSSWQTWSYCMDGSPDLHDPVFQCSPCTDKNGYEFSNCHPPEAYQWRNPVEPHP